MNAPNYRINYREKKPFRIIIIIIILVILLFIFKPLTWLRKTLYVKSLRYKSTHDPVYFSSLKAENKKLPIEGKIISSYSENGKGINISPTTTPTEVRVIDIGVITDIGYNENEKYYVKVRHVLENNRDIFYTYYSNLPEKPNLRGNEWVGSSTILYLGNNLDYLHFEVLDFNGNQIDPTGYINIE